MTECVKGKIDYGRRRRKKEQSVGPPQLGYYKENKNWVRLAIPKISVRVVEDCLQIKA